MLCLLCAVVAWDPMKECVVHAFVANEMQLIGCVRAVACIEEGMGEQGWGQEVRVVHLWKQTGGVECTVCMQWLHGILPRMIVHELQGSKLRRYLGRRGMWASMVCIEVGMEQQGWALGVKSGPPVGVLYACSC